MKLPVTFSVLKKFKSKKIIIPAIAVAVLLTAGAVVAVQAHGNGKMQEAATTATAQRSTKQDAKKAANAPETSEDVKGDSTSAPAASAGKPATSSSKPASSGSTPSTPTNYPLANLKPWTPSTPDPMKVTGVSITLGPLSCISGFQKYSYTYTLDFNTNNAGGITTGQWEASSDGGATIWWSTSLPTSLFYQNPQYGTRVYESSPPGMFTSLPGQTTYTARIHITSPNSVVSNWVTVPAGVAC